VQVLVTVVDKARNEVHANQVLQRVQVVEVGRDTSLVGPTVGVSDSSAPSRGAITSLTLALTPDQAVQLAEARRTGELDVLLLPPGEVQNQ
jgi:hypothetical protein